MSLLAISKERIIDFSASINNRSTRERVLIFCAVQLFVLAVIGYGLLLPRWQLKMELVRKIEMHKATLTATLAETETRKAVGSIDPDSTNRELLKQINLQADESRADLIKINTIFIEPEDMVSRLQGIVKLNGKLKLVSLNTLVVDNLMSGKSTVENNPASPSVSSNLIANKNSPLVIDGVYRHGVALVVQGSYLDMVDYLIGLESHPTGFYWGNMKMQVDVYPLVTMHITLFTLSLDRKW